jgi:DNA adenine methylase
MIGPWIISHFPAHRIYVEPYCGGASVLMRKPRAFGEVINDLDEEVVNLFRVLRDRGTARDLQEQLRLTPYSRVEFEASYEPSADPVEQARRTVVRSFMAFGTTSLRRNRTGFRSKCYRNNSTGVRDWASYPDLLREAVERLQGVLVECSPALEVIARQDGPETLFYVDPPYPVEVRTSVTCPSDQDRAYRHDLTTDDHRELAEALRSVRGMVVLSGYDCPLYRGLFGDWQTVRRAALADGARERTEVLWLNPAAAERQRQQSLWGGVAPPGSEEP